MDIHRHFQFGAFRPERVQAGVVRMQASLVPQSASFVAQFSHAARAFPVAANQFRHSGLRVVALPGAADVQPAPELEAAGKELQIQVRQLVERGARGAAHKETHL